MPWWLRVAVAVVGVLALLIVLLWVFQRRFVYLPDTSAVPPAATVLPGGQDVTLRTADGLDLAAWYVPAPAAGASPSGSCRATVLIAGGNAGNRAGRAPLAQALVDEGFGVLLVDYRGYGGNPGAPTETGLAADMRAAHRFLTVDRRLGDQELIYFGESLGAAAVTELATEYPPAGLLLRSPFTELADVAQEHFPALPVRLLLRDRFPVRDGISQVTAPITVVYGTADTVVPADLSVAVADGAGGPVELIALPGADHNDSDLVAGPAVIDGVRALAVRAGCAPGR